MTDANAILEALEGCEALLIGSSAKVATLEFDTGVIDPATGRPKLGFPKGQPYEVDWLGQRNQIDAAQKCGCTHVVICSSMGGTDPEHMLNGLGREESDPPSKGNILQWKRKAEKYLIESGLTYTIIHPGGLVDKPGGCRELVVGVDDVMVDGGVEINQCVGCNSSQSHLSALTLPCWLRSAVRNRHRHAIEQASRRWRGGRRDDSAQTRRKILISTQVDDEDDAEAAPAVIADPALSASIRDALDAAGFSVDGADRVWVPEDRVDAPPPHVALDALDALDDTTAVWHNASS